MSTNPRKVSELTEAISSEIRAERARQRLSQREVYEAAGISRSTYVRIEAAARGIDVEQLINIAGALGLPASELARRAEDKIGLWDRGEQGRVLDLRERRPELPAHVPTHVAALHSEVSHHDADVAREESP